MNGELAQYTALATWATIGLRQGVQAAAPGLGLANDAFGVVRKLGFGEAGSAQSWPASLAAQGIERVWLVVDPVLIGPRVPGVPTWRDEFAFVNALNARAGLLAGEELWRGGLTAAEPPGPDARVWDADYRAVRAPASAGAGVRRGPLPARPRPGRGDRLHRPASGGAGLGRGVRPGEATRRIRGSDAAVLQSTVSRGGLPGSLPSPGRDGSGRVGVRRHGLVERRGFPGRGDRGRVQHEDQSRDPRHTELESGAVAR